MLVLLEHLPEDSAFKQAYNEYDWPLVPTLLTWLYNEVHAARGDSYGEGFTFRPILTPSMARAKAEKTAQARQAHDDVIAQLRGG